MSLPPAEIPKRFSTVVPDPLNPRRTDGPMPMSVVGGLAVSFAALRHPDVFGNVISQSGSY